MRLKRGTQVVVSVVLTATAVSCSIFRVANTLSDITRSGEQGDSFPIVGYDVPAPKPRAFAAGAAWADITPPPGFPTGGHGPAGDLARGYWIRLRSRAFFFEDSAGHALALVSADLFAIPGGLRQKVASLATEELRRRGIQVFLPPETVVIAATHTHHGPGNFMTARIYNQFGSSYPGFSAELFTFVADRIAESIVSAAQQARQHSDAVELSVHVHHVGYDLLRNRSPRTFLLNRNRSEILAQLNDGKAPPVCSPKSGEPSDAWDLAGCPRLRAVDRALTVLEVSRATAGSRTRVAALVFFAAHPTDLPGNTPFYSPDFVGEAMLLLEQRLNAHQGEPTVVGFFNGAEGDVTLRRRERDLRETIAFGNQFAQEVEAALSAGGNRILTSTGIAIRGRAWHPENEGSCGRDGVVRMAPSPVFGAAALGGAEDDRTQLYVLGWRDGVRDSASGAQGVKLPALDSRILRGARFTSEFAPANAFPRSLPLSVVAIGDFTIAAVPVEASTAQGRSLRDVFQLPHGKLELVGLANEYASYCASRDEYWVQDYMGASTLWGPNEGPYLVCRLEELSRTAPIEHGGTIPSADYWPGTTPMTAFGPSFLGETRRPDDGLEQMLLDENKSPERQLPWFGWSEPETNSFESASKRTTAIWVKERGTWRRLELGSPPRAESDLGDGFLSMYLGRGRWAAIWLRPLLIPLQGTFAFVTTSGSGIACSAEFTLDGRRTWPDEIPTASSCKSFTGEPPASAERL